MANLALIGGLMGAAHGVTGGLYDEWKQGQQDQRDARLAQAQWNEKVQLLKLQQQYDSANNVQKVALGLQAGLARDAANNDAKAALASQDQAFKAEQDAADRASREKTAGISAGATIEAAKLRNAADQNGGVKPRLVAVKGKDGSITAMAIKPGDVIPAGSTFQNFNGDASFMMPTGLLGGFGASPADTAAPAPSSAAAAPTVSNPADTQTATATAPTTAPPSSGYPDGTHLSGPGGKVYVVQNGVPVPVGN